MKIAPLLMLILFLVACKKTSNTANGKIPILGVWTWESSSGGIGGLIETPSTTGTTKTLEFKDDGTYLFGINKIMPSKGTYLLNVRHCIHEDKNKMSIKMSGFNELTIEQQTNNTIILADEFPDGFTHHYKKE